MWEIVRLHGAGDRVKKKLKGTSLKIIRFRQILRDEFNK